MSRRGDRPPFSKNSKWLLLPLLNMLGAIFPLAITLSKRANFNFKNYLDVITAIFPFWLMRWALCTMSVSLIFPAENVFLLGDQ